MWNYIAVASYASDKGGSGDPVAEQRREYSDGVEKKMTPSQIAEAQQITRECIRKKYKDC